jgi:RHS repeat-associated protein
LTGAAGALALVQSFDPYGGLLSSQGSAATPYGFTGEWGDASGLLNLRARYYLPQAGIFTARDPFPGFTTLPVTMQPYLYAAGNPLRYTDPSGQFIFLALLVVAAVGGLIGGVGYYGLQLYFNHDPCARWNWKDAVFWGGVGTGIGTLLGVGIAFWMSAATTAAVTGGGAATTAATTALNATGGDPSDELNALSESAQNIGSSVEQIAQGTNQFWTSTTNFRGNLVYQRPDLIDPDLTQSGLTNLQRMEQGLAPYGPDGNRISLHHMLQSMDGPIAEVTQTFHQVNSSIIHINPNTVPSGINRAAFNVWRAAYWVNRAKDFVEK